MSDLSWLRPCWFGGMWRRSLALSVDKDAFGDSGVQILEVIALHVASALERMESSA